MATYNEPAGTTSFSATLTASTADTVTFADRAGYINVANTGTTVLYVRADGTAATIAGANCYAVAPGTTAILANGQLLWYPSSKVTTKGVNQFGGGNTTTSPPSPGMVQSQESLAGGMANPGTVVSIISSAADSYTVSLAG
jgi:hypothetical protein